MRLELRDPCWGFGVETEEANAKDHEEGAPPEIAKIVVSCYFASYHVVVVSRFLPWWWALLAFVGLAVVGRGLVWLVEDSRFGLLTAIGAHVGLDVTFCLIVAEMYYNIVPAMA